MILSWGISTEILYGFLIATILGYVPISSYNSLPLTRFSFRHLNGKVSVWLLKKCFLQHGDFSHRLNFNFKSNNSAGKKSVSALLCSLCNNTAYGLVKSEFPENEIRKREGRLMLLWELLAFAFATHRRRLHLYCIQREEKKLAWFYYTVIRQKHTRDTNARLSIVQFLFQARSEAKRSLKDVVIKLFHVITRWFSKEEIQF